MFSSSDLFPFLVTNGYKVMLCFGNFYVHLTIRADLSKKSCPRAKIPLSPLGVGKGTVSPSP